MRLRVRTEEADLVVGAVIGLLRYEGYDATPLTGTDEAAAAERVRAWLGTGAASELSREEARTLAADIVSRFQRERAIAPMTADRLRSAVADRLYRSFTADDAAAHVGALVERALPEVAGAVRAYLAPRDASAFEAFLEAWRPAPE